MPKSDEPTSTPRPITWLHLSDFHFASREGWDRRQTLKALVKYLGERAEKGWSPDFIFATGDIAWSGRREEFEQAQLFFRELGKSLRLSEDEFRSRLFVIPGNHDVDRGAIGPMDDFTVAFLLRAEGAARQELLAKTMGDAATMRLLGRRLTEYYLFTERQFGAARRVPEERPWRVDFREVAGVEVAILQLNTACFSGPKDGPEKLLLGRLQVDDALAEAWTARLRFVLQHHPFGFLADGREVKARLRQPDGGHILLRGHLHDTEEEQTPDDSLIELAAGAVNSDTDWLKRFLIGAADLNAGKATVEFFTYSAKGAGFWAPDTVAYAAAPEGIVVFDLPSRLRTDRARRAPARDHRGRLLLTPGAGDEVGDVADLAPPKPEVFLSYAWGDDESPEGRLRAEAADRLCAELRQDFTVHRDRDAIHPGESISDYIDKLTHGQYLVALVSDKYLRSPYCMFEIYKLYQACQGEKKQLLERVVPVVLPEVKIGRFPDRAQYLEYWSEETERYEVLLGNPRIRPGETTMKEYRLVRDFANHVDDILGFIADVLMPRRTDDFSVVRQTLRRKMGLG